MKHRQRNIWELVGFAVLILVVCSLSLATYISRSDLDRKRLLVEELETLRLAVLAYGDENASAPADLEQALYFLCKGQISCTTVKNVDGFYLDPFGERYMYDKKTGWVYTSTEDLSTW